MKRREQRRVSNARGKMEVERLSRLTKLTPLITSYESLSEEEKAEVAISLQKITKDLPTEPRRIDEISPDLEVDSPNTQPDDPCGYTDVPSATNGPPLSVTRDDCVGSALDEVTPDPMSPAITTESADSELPPTQTTADLSEGYPTRSPNRVSSMLATLYSSFLASARQMGSLLSPRTVLPRPEEQDDETKVTQELSQAQRRLVAEEESIWKWLSETTREGGIERDVSSSARELEDKSAKILTSYERRNNPPTSEVYDQSRIILRAMGVPCIITKGGVEGEALAAAIVRDGLAHYVASEDTVGVSPPF